MYSRKLIAAALLALTVGLTGCSSSDKSTDGKGSTSDSTTGSGKEINLPECPTPATLKAELGIDYNEAATGGSGKEHNCAYTPVDPTQGNAMVHFQVLAAAGDFDAIKIGYGAGGRTVQTVSGVGDGAFSSVLSAGGKDTNTVAAHKGTFHVLVTSRAPLDKVTALVTKLLG